MNSLEQITKRLPNPDSVSAGTTATFRIPVGRRIHQLLLEYVHSEDLNVSHFTEIRIFINGSVFQRFSGTRRDKINQFDKRAAANGVLVIPFDRTGLKTVAGEEETAINTGVADANGRKISQMYMEIDIAAGATVSASDLKLSAIESDSIEGGAGMIPYIRTEQRTAAGATNDFQIADLVNPGLNAPDKVALSRVHFTPSAGSISQLEVNRNTYTLFERSDALNRAIQADGVRTPIAGQYTVDTAERGHGSRVISLYGMTDYRYRLDVSEAMTIECTSEYFGVLQ